MALEAFVRGEVCGGVGGETAVWGEVTRWVDGIFYMGKRENGHGARERSQGTEQRRALAL